MEVQDILHAIGIALIARGVIALLVMLYLIFAKNIRDVHADLTGKKRMEGVEKMRAAGTREGSKPRRVARTVDADAQGVRVVSPGSASATPTMVQDAATPAVAGLGRLSTAKQKTANYRTDSSGSLDTGSAATAGRQQAACDRRKTAESLDADSDEAAATTIIGEDTTATTILTKMDANNEDSQSAEAMAGTGVKAVAESKHNGNAQPSEEQVDAVTRKADKDVSEKAVPSSDKATAKKPVSMPKRSIPDGFTIVRKIVLAQDVDLVYIKQGEENA